MVTKYYFNVFSLNPSTSIQLTKNKIRHNKKENTNNQGRFLSNTLLQIEPALCDAQMKQMKCSQQKCNVQSALKPYGQSNLLKFIFIIRLKFPILFKRLN